MMRDKKLKELEEIIVSLAGNPDERVEERDGQIRELEEKIDHLQRQLYQKDKAESKGKPASESEKIIADLSKQNATLRLKIANLTEQLSAK